MLLSHGRIGQIDPARASSDDVGSREAPSGANFRLREPVDPTPFGEPSDVARV